MTTLQHSFCVSAVAACFYTVRHSFIVLATRAGQEDPNRWDPVHTTLEKFENAALFLRLGLTSTLIRHDNGAFRNRSLKQGNLKTQAVSFSADGKHFEKEAFRERCTLDDHLISLCEFSLMSTKIQNDRGLLSTEDEKHLLHFQIQSPFSFLRGQ